MSVQPDFLQQKCEIEEKITASPNGAYPKIIYYPKFHCELNHIEYFWCNGERSCTDRNVIILLMGYKNMCHKLWLVLKILPFLGCYD